MQPLNHQPQRSSRVSLHRNGCALIRGIVHLRGPPRPSLSIVSDGPNPITHFHVPLARSVNPIRNSQEVIFSLPIAPFDVCRITFDSINEAHIFHKTLTEIEANIPADPPHVVYRPSAGLGVRQDRPRPISAAAGYPSTVVQQLNARLRPAEAPAALAPPPPPKRNSSLRHDGRPPPLPRLPSPRSSSLPSTSNSLPEDFRSSRSLEPNDLTLVPATPTSPTPVTPQPPSPNFGYQLEKKFGRKNFPVAVDDGLEAFYPPDIVLIRHLERGSQGSVDLVSTKFYRRVALKYFDRRVRQWEAAATRELFSLLKTVTHPNIVQSRGVLFASPLEREKPLGVLMEYMDCGSVSSAIYDQSIHYPLTTPLNWCRQAASALAFLHRRRLVHRDVKPANMLLCDGGKKLKISDFGLCATVDSGMTADVGTVVYMAPEVVAGHSLRTTYDEKCDVYSLGISLWEMTHRRRPHDGIGFLALLSGVREGNRPLLDKESCPPDLFQLIQRMWLEDGKTRPDMEEVHEEVNKMLDTLGFFEIYE